MSLSVDIDGKIGEAAISPRTHVFSSPENRVIRCMFLCWFDTTAGPKIALQVPEGVLSREQFDSISAFVIPKSQLCNCVLGATIDGLTVIGSPQVVTNERYLRNEYIFNVCVCVREDCDSEILADCETLVRKLGNYMNVLERDYEYLSQFTNPSVASNTITQSSSSGVNSGNLLANINVNDDAGPRYAKQGSNVTARYKTAIPAETTPVKWNMMFRELLEQIYYELNLGGYSKVRVNDATSILLRLRAGPRAFAGARHMVVPFNSGRLVSGLSEVHEYDVPILVQSVATERTRERERERDSQSDPTVRQLLTFVNGERHVLQIALETDINLSIAKACFQNLIHFGVVRLISVFQFSNAYMCTERVSLLVADALSAVSHSMGADYHRGCASNHPFVSSPTTEIFDGEDNDEECVCFRRALRDELQVCFKEARDSKTKASPVSAVSVDDIINVALFFKQFDGVSVRHVCDRMDATLLQRVDVRKLIQFGELHAILRRVHCYPVFSGLRNDAAGAISSEKRSRGQVPIVGTATVAVGGDSKWQQIRDVNTNWKGTERTPASALAHSVGGKAAASRVRSPAGVTFARDFDKPEWYVLCDGKHHTDEIYCLYALPYNTVNDAIDHDPDLLVIWK